MRFLPAMVGISLLATACHKSPKPAELSADAKMSQLIVGSWAISKSSILEFDADGSATTTWSNRSGMLSFYQSDWKITNGYCLLTVNNVVAQNTNHEAIGSIDRMKIIRLDSTNLTFSEPVNYESNGVVWQEEEAIAYKRLK